MTKTTQKLYQSLALSMKSLKSSGYHWSTDFLTSDSSVKNQLPLGKMWRRLQPARRKFQVGQILPVCPDAHALFKATNHKGKLSRNINLRKSYAEW
jgi:hypothetical protein